ncbi:hypothetical protein RIR_v02001087000 [Rhizophagus irregularis DAOM 181602=DAOM 197198]|nr:hypothetical protein RIR_v02001087000 [Rhizophagus irregularis DAOM 181602=DAOM 197198]
MYCQLEFKRNLRHWSERKRFDDILTDIYDGQVWKNFKEISNENSIRVIYATICNLPRDMQFKRENMLVLGLLLSPNEVSLHQINNYLAPIVNELVLLWDGVMFDNTFEYQESTSRNRTIRPKFD